MERMPMIWFLGVLAAGYFTLTAGMYAGQRSLMYHPSDRTPLPSLSGVPEMQAVRLPAGDGVELFAWWRPPVREGAPTLVYFHGNAGNLDDRAGRARFFLDQGYGLLLKTYRYNAGAGGRPSEAALIADGFAAVDWLAAEHGVGAERIALYGESLGSGIAAALLAEGRGAALIVDGGFDSIAHVAQGAYPYLPAKWLVKDRFDNAARLGAAHGAPKLIVHGGRDRIIPLKRARALYDAAAEPKRLEILEEGGHSDLYDHGMADLVNAFLEEAFGQRER
eukprot:g833.t1